MGGSDRKRELRGSTEITWEPREHIAKMVELCRGQRTWGKGRGAQRLETFRGGCGVCQPG